MKRLLIISLVVNLVLLAGVIYYRSESAKAKIMVEQERMRATINADRADKAASMARELAEKAQEAADNAHKRTMEALDQVDSLRNLNK